MMSTKPYHLTKFSSQVFPLVISCQQTTKPVYRYFCQTTLSFYKHIRSLRGGQYLKLLAKSLDPDESSGIDTIGPTVLKKFAYTLCGPWHHLFVTSLSKHTIPFDWHTHVITPVHKSGDKSLVKVTIPYHDLVIHTSKTLEWLIYNKVIHHISSFLTPKQFGFLKADPHVQFNNCYLVYYLMLS